jgi:hypothetical protein
MTKRQSNILSVILVAIGFVALSTVLLFSTERILSMSEAELFENLIGTFRILEDFHPSVATCLALFSLTVLWTTWIVYLTFCIIISVRWFKEKRNDS